MRKCKGSEPPGRQSGMPAEFGRQVGLVGITGLKSHIGKAAASKRDRPKRVTDTLHRHEAFWCEPGLAAQSALKGTGRDSGRVGHRRHAVGAQATVARERMVLLMGHSRGGGFQLRSQVLDPMIQRADDRIQ